ncbi:calcium-dependent protein kinase 28-like [Iris pallida]|uniref:Calcium-dependent protein kinase 28-like n=1 Tax=Iris pallida TaxID=29817 RepID=A0AAX6H8R6_IRIPA|nr:calcium-dependent protein kinase 28-like [Iris pallida]
MFLFENKIVHGIMLGHPWIVDAGMAPGKPLAYIVLSRLKQFLAMNKLKKIALQDHIDNKSILGEDIHIIRSIIG